MKRLLAISAFLFASSALAATDLTGQWTIHNSIAGNENDQVCKLAVADNKITGSCKSQDKDLPVTGTVDGNKVTWQFQSEYNGSPLTLIYKATLDDSNKIVGTVEVQPYGVTGDFTATPTAESSLHNLGSRPLRGNLALRAGERCDGSMVHPFQHRRKRKRPGL